MPQPKPSHHDVVAIIDYGSQTSQLITRRVREANVYGVLVPWDIAAEELRLLKPAGVILSGGPSSVYDEDAPTLPGVVLELGVPVLGICYGMQLLAKALGGQVAAAQNREYGQAELVNEQNSPLFEGLGDRLQVWMSHGDRIETLPDGFGVLAHSANTPIAAMADETRRLYGLQFHPEVAHTPRGSEILANFIRICGCRGDWGPGSFIEEHVADIRQTVGDGKVVCGVSGGVDSSVVAALVHRAIGKQLTAVFVDNGLMRKNEVAETNARYRAMLGESYISVDAS